MPRPPLPPGTHGHIKCKQVGERQWRARCRYRDDTGALHWVERYDTTATKAEYRLTRALQNWTGDAGGEITRDTYTRDLLEPYLDELREDDRSPTTLRLYESHGRNHILPALGGLRVGEVTVGRVDQLLRSMRRTHGADTVRGVRAVISGMFARAVRFGAIEHNPVRDTRRITGDARTAKSLTNTQRLELLRHLDADQRAAKLDLPDLTRFMLGTGARIGETLAVRWSRIDLDSEPATVQMGTNLVWVKGVGLVERHDTSKAKKRPIPLPDFLVVMLTARRLKVTGPADPVFPALRGASRGHGWRDPSNVESRYREALDRAGFEWVTSHVFRKTAATTWNDAGLTPREVADLLGHDRISYTQDVYFGRSLGAHPTAAQLLQRAYTEGGTFDDHE